MFSDKFHFLTPYADISHCRYCERQIFNGSFRTNSNKFIITTEISLFSRLKDKCFKTNTQRLRVSALIRTIPMNDRCHNIINNDSVISFTCPHVQIQ